MMDKFYHLFAAPFLGTLKARASPKSANFNIPFLVIRTFAAFISLCKICKYFLINKSYSMKSYGKKETKWIQLRNNG